MYTFNLLLGFITEFKEEQENEICCPLLTKEGSTCFNNLVLRTGFGIQKLIPRLEC